MHEVPLLVYARVATGKKGRRFTLQKPFLTPLQVQSRSEKKEKKEEGLLFSHIHWRVQPGTA